jgi:hypothetical protein
MYIELKRAVTRRSISLYQAQNHGEDTKDSTRYADHMNFRDRQG